MNGVANEPDSVYLFSYSHADGSGGLKLAWSPDGNRWFSVAEGSSFVNSDFGPWGQMKRMLKPHLMQTRADDRWHCIWELTESGNSLAYVESPDLLQWKAQKYFDRSRLAEYRPAEVYPNVRKEVLLNGTVQQGWMQRVPYATVQRVISFAEHKKYRQALHAERTEQDPVRFAGLKPVEATIEVETECAKPISKHLIGIFFEDINYAADGGLYAELVQNRDFEYSSKDGSHQGWDGSWRKWLNGVAFIKQIFVVKLFEQPPKCFDITVVVSNVRIVHIHPITHFGREVFPFFCIFKYIFSAGSVIIVHTDF
jgi:hypothetical protein